jgi:hypothetical protein
VTKGERYFNVAGATVFLAFIGSVELLRHAPYDSGLRGAGRGAVAAAGLLAIVWELGAAVFASFRWRSTGITFRSILALNGALVFLLLRDVVLDL